jgi:hypothetical protein
MDASPAELKCSNCDHALDVSDKFCRECGLPTLRRAQQQHAAVVEPPDTHEMRRALDAVPDPRPFQRPGITAPTGTTRDETTSSVVQVTNPTFAASWLAGPSLVMVGLMILFALGGIVLLVLAFRP